MSTLSKIWLTSSANMMMFSQNGTLPLLQISMNQAFSKIKKLSERYWFSKFFLTLHHQRKGIYEKISFTVNSIDLHHSMLA